MFALMGQGAAALPKEVAKSVKLKPGIYKLTAPLAVTGSNVVLDGGGATLQGAGSGIGITIGKEQNVTIKNLKVKGFQWGIRAEGAAGLKLISVDASGNGNHFEAMSGTVVASVLGDKEPDYGGGIFLKEVTTATLQNVDAHGQWNGLTLSGCSKVIVEKSDFSKNDSTGVHLWSTRETTVRDCRINWIGLGIVKNGRFSSKGGDQAGILVEHDSHKNTFLRNQLVHCGDRGVLLRANEAAALAAPDAAKQGYSPVGETPVWVATHPSKENTFQENDASFAENGTAFESKGNVGNRFIQNIAAFSGAGFVLDFSRNTIVRGNLIVGNKTVGARAHNAWNLSIEGNSFVREQGSPLAIAFSDEDANAAKPRDGAQNRSGGTSVFDNLFVGYTKPLRFTETSPATVQANTIFNVEPMADEAELATVVGALPLFVNNVFERHTSPDLVTSTGPVAMLPSVMDTVGGISLTRVEPKTSTAIVYGSLTGRFEGEEFELARLTKLGRVTFPPRLVKVVYVKGASTSPASFLALLGDQTGK